MSPRSARSCAGWARRLPGSASISSPGFRPTRCWWRGTRVLGVRTTPSGLDRQGQPGSEYQPPTDLTARIVILAEGTRGPLTPSLAEPGAGSGALTRKSSRSASRRSGGLPGPSTGSSIPSGWPIPLDAFGGSFLYPMGQDQVALGLVAGLDARDSGFDVHELLQRMKLHKFFRRVLEGGRAGRMGRQDDPRGRILEPARPVLGRWADDRG